MNYIPILGFANQKGGVGKTTISRIACEYPAMFLNKKVLGWDNDPQSSLTIRYFGRHDNPVTGYKEPPIHPHYDKHNPLLKNWDGKSSSADIFYNNKVRPYPTHIENLDVVPANEGRLFQAERVKRREMEEKVYSQLHSFLTLPEVQKEYDLCVIDCPPAKESPLTIAAFKAMTHLIIPIELEIQALEGLKGLLQLWKQEATSRPTTYPLHLLGILPNKVHSRRGIDNDLLADIRGNPIYGKYVMPVELVDRNSFPKSDLQCKSIFEFPKNDEAKKEALKVCDFIYKRIFP